MVNQKTNIEFNKLCHFSAQIGSDPEQVQGAGGNTSIKCGDTLWIKASGTWLANASKSELFVPVALTPLRSALAEGDPRAEKSVDFVDASFNTADLRPSIETTVHAVIPEKVVVHVHCVDTIALAIQANAQQLLNERLLEFKWLWVPYFRPGLPLSRFISANLKPGVDVIVLGNHGLVVAADTVDEAALLLARVRKALAQVARPASKPNIDRLQQLSRDTQYKPAPDAQTHAIAMDEHALGVAGGGSLYPDHVIFLGAGTVIVNDVNSLKDTTDALKQQHDSATMSIVIPDIGVLMHDSSNTSQHAMARCLSDVCLRIENGTPIHYLNSDDLHQLLNWEAETYRQSIAT